jgi:hypothetical protein
MKRLSRPLMFLVCVLMLTGDAGGFEDQIPDKFTNLKILPSGVPRAELVRVMREFASALGVRCNHCHVGENPATISRNAWTTCAAEAMPSVLRLRTPGALDFEATARTSAAVATFVNRGSQRFREQAFHRQAHRRMFPGQRG